MGSSCDSQSVHTKAPSHSTHNCVCPVHIHTCPFHILHLHSPPDMGTEVYMCSLGAHMQWVYHEKSGLAAVTVQATAASSPLGMFFAWNADGTHQSERHNTEQQIPTFPVPPPPRQSVDRWWGWKEFSFLELIGS